MLLRPDKLAAHLQCQAKESRATGRCLGGIRNRNVSNDVQIVVYSHREKGRMCLNDGFIFVSGASGQRALPHLYYNVFANHKQIAAGVTSAGRQEVDRVKECQYPEIVVFKSAQSTSWDNYNHGF